MKRVAIVLTVLVAGCTLTRGSGNLASEPRALDGFDAISVSAPVDVQVAVGSVYGVSVEADDNLLELIRTRVEGSTLVIDTPPNQVFTSEQTVRVLVSTPNLSEIDVSGSGSATAVDVDTDRFDIDVSGSGSVTLAGAAGVLIVDVSGSGLVDTRDLATGDAEVSVSGSGTVTVSVSDSLEADVSGSGSVEYLGDPTVRSNVSGSGSVSQGG